MKQKDKRGMVILQETKQTKRIGMLRFRNKKGNLVSLSKMKASPIPGTLRLQKEWGGGKRTIRVVDIKIKELDNKIKTSVPVEYITSYCPITEVFLNGPLDIIEMGPPT